MPSRPGLSCLRTICHMKTGNAWWAGCRLNALPTWRKSLLRSNSCSKTSILPVKPLLSMAVIRCSEELPTGKTMPDSPAFLVERLKTEGEKTAAFFSALTEQQWKLPVYAEGETPDNPGAGWTVRSMLSHYVSSELELRRLFVD